MGKSWNIPRFDVYDPSLVFYAPLWRPDMVARGGAIKNGTGTMGVSPQALAVGANTITVTVAGTLIVNIPEGGTVASGTMTVTGSPVTVSAGIATTITTTGATGNITVTPSNIIRSKDRNNLAMTVTGTTWGSQGRSFDGDDNIRIIAPSALKLYQSDFTVLIWGKELVRNPSWVSHYAGTTTAGGGWAFWSQGAANAEAQWGKSRLDLNDGTASSGSISTNIAFSLGEWAFVAISYTFSTQGVVHYCNGNLNGTGTLTKAIPDVSLDFYLGRQAGTSYALNGIEGEVWVCNKALSQPEIQQIRLATRWRYV